MKITIPTFKAALPRVSDKLLPTENAVLAKDCILTHGDLRPISKPEKVEDLYSFPSDTTNTVFRWFDGADWHWLQFPSHVDVVRGPVADDVYRRIYWTGDSRYSTPRMAYTPGITTGQNALPGVSYRLGIPAPTSEIEAEPDDPASGAVSTIYNERPIKVVTQDKHGLEFGDLVQLTISSDGPNSSLADLINPGEWQITVVDDYSFTLNNTDAANVSYNQFQSGSWKQFIDPGLVGSRFYVYTYVSEIGEEGPPSDPSEQIDLGGRQGAQLTIPSMDPNISGNYNINRIRIYRTATGNFSGQFQFVDELPVSDATYHDVKSDSVLGETIPSTEYDPPPDKLKGLRVTAQGFGVGFYDNKVCFSEPNLLHAWPTSYQVALDSDIVSLEVVDGGIVVGTVGRPYLIQGIDPRSMMPRELGVDYACIAKRSIVTFGYGVVYASDDGLVYVPAGGQPILITEGILTPEQWQGFIPETMFACRLGALYVGFTQNGTFMLDPRAPQDGIAMSSVDKVVSAYTDPSSAAVYLLKNRSNAPNPGSTPEIYSWDRYKGDKESFEWVSKVFALPIPINMAAARVQIMASNDGNTTLTLIANGEEIYTHTVTDNNPFWLPAGYLARQFQVKLKGYGTIEQVNIADGIDEVNQ